VGRDVAWLLRFEAKSSGARRGQREATIPRLDPGHFPSSAIELAALDVGVSDEQLVTEGQRFGAGDLSAFEESTHVVDTLSAT